MEPSGASRVRITLDLEPDGLIRGRVSGSRQQADDFHGWLELAAALERARNGRLGAPGDLRSVALPDLDGDFPPAAV